MTIQNKTYKLFGVAGAGKTTKCLELIKNFITQGYSINDISFTTFTRAGIASIKQKLQENNIFLPEENFFRTMHSLTWRLSQFNDFLDFKKFCEEEKIKYKNDSTEENEKTIGEYVEESYEKIQNIKVKKVENMSEKEIEVALLEFFEFDEEMIFEKRQAIVLGLKSLSEYKKKTGKKTFSDSFIEILEKKIDLPVKILIVDEAQDLFNAQIEVIKLWTKVFDKEIFVLAGDDDQAVHYWAGSNANFLIEYENNNMEKIILEESYRCPKNVANFCNLILEQINYRQKKKIIPRKEIGIVSFINFPKKITDITRLVENDQKTFFLFRTNKLKQLVAQLIFERTDIAFSYLGDRTQSPYTLKYCIIHNAILKLSRQQSISFEEACKLVEVIRKEILFRGIKTNFEKKTNLEVISYAYFFTNIVNWGFRIHDIDFEVKENLLKNIDYIHYSKNNLEKSLEKNEVVRRKIIGSEKIIGFQKVLVGDKNKVEMAVLPLQLGTFHASKGLEAEKVFVFLGTNKFFSVIDDNEYRCFYVASSRSSKDLIFVNTFFFDEEFYLYQVFEELFEKFLRCS